MSFSIDGFVKTNGLAVTLYCFTELVYDDHDNLDLENSKYITQKTFMVIGNRKSEVPSLLRDEAGWDYQDNLLVTFFPTDAKVSPEKGIDAVVVEMQDGKRYRVNRTDFDYILGTIKKKVFLEPLRGNIKL